MNAMLAFVQQVFDWTWRNSVQAAVLIVLVLLLQKLLSRWLTPRLRYTLSLLVICRLLLPFAPPSSLSLTNFFTSAPPKMPAASTAPSANESTLPAPTQAAAASVHLAPGAARLVSRLTLAQALVCGWACGLVTLVGLASWRYARWSRLVQRGQRLTDARLVKLLDEAREGMGVRRPVTLIALPNLSSPAVFGWRRPFLLLPQRLLAQLSDAEWRLIFLHEMAHVRRLDVPLNILLIAVQFLHWFNPLVWLGLHRLRADRELVCDAMVVRQMAPDERAGYGRLLIKLLDDFAADKVFATAVPVVGTKREINTRIRLIKRHRRSSPIALLTTALIALGLGCTTFTSPSQPPPTRERTPQPPAAAAREPSRQLPDLVVRIDAKGSLTVADKPLALKDLRPRLSAELANNPNLSLAIEADQSAPYKELVKVLDEVKAAKVERVRLRTSIGEAQRAAARDFYKRAMTHDRAHQYEGELADLNQALDLDPNHTEALFSRACLYADYLPIGKRDDAKAVADYTRVLELEPMNCSARHNRALSYEQLREPDKALADYTRMIEGNVDFSRLIGGKDKQQGLDHFYRGRIYQSSKHDYARAVTDYNAALRLDPELAEPGAGGRIILRRGQAYQALKQYAQAQADYDLYQTIDPSYGELWMCWAWQLATASERDFRDGTKALEYAMKGNQNLEVIAAAYAENGDFPNAVENQAKAIAALDSSRKPSGNSLSGYGFDLDSRTAMESRLALYKAGRPYHAE